LSEACAWGLAFASFVWRRLIYSVGLFVASILSRRLLLSIPLAMSAPASWLVAAAALDLCFSAVVFVLLLRASIRRLKAASHDESPSPEQPRWVQTWTDMVSVSPLCQTIFNWDKSRTLDRNPVAWLQEYSWTARLTKWGWFGLALLAVLIELLGSDSQDVAFRHFLLTAALTLGLAFSASGSFQREHQTGLLEQLLVTPLSVGQILGGRLWGIFGHYLPALAMLWFGWGGVQLLNPKFQANEIMIAMFPNPMIMVLLMITGLYFSLSRMNFFLAWGLTWVVGFVFPVIVMIALPGFGVVSKPDAFGIGLALQATLAAALWLLLQRKVRQRSFLLLPHE
jgi:hypothetical protein